MDSSSECYQQVKEMLSSLLPESRYILRREILYKMEMISSILSSVLLYEKDWNNNPSGDYSFSHFSAEIFCIVVLSLYYSVVLFIFSILGYVGIVLFLRFSYNTNIKEEVTSAEPVSVLSPVPVQGVKQVKQVVSSAKGTKAHKPKQKKQKKEIEKRVDDSLEETLPSLTKDSPSKEVIYETEVETTVLSKAEIELKPETETELRPETETETEPKVLPQADPVVLPVVTTMQPLTPSFSDYSVELLIEG